MLDNKIQKYGSSLSDIQINLKNMRFDPDKDSYFKSTTKSKLRQLRYLKNQRQAKRLKKLLMNKKLTTPEDIINSEKNIFEIYQKKSLSSCIELIIHKNQNARSQILLGEKSHILAKKKNKKILNEEFYLTGGVIQKKSKNEKKIKNDSKLIGILGDSPTSEFIKKMKKEQFKQEFERARVEETKNQIDKFVKYFEKRKIEDRYKKVRFKTPRNPKIRHRGLNFSVRSGSIFNAALPKHQRGIRLLKEKVNKRKRIQSSEKKRLMKKVERERKKLKSRNQRSFVISKKKSNSAPKRMEKSAVNLKYVWIKSMKKSRGSPDLKKIKYKKYKTEIKKKLKKKRKRKNKKGGGFQRSLNYEYKNNISSREERAFYKDLEMITLDDR